MNKKIKIMILSIIMLSINCIFSNELELKALSDQEIATNLQEREVQDEEQSIEAEDVGYGQRLKYVSSFLFLLICKKQLPVEKGPWLMIDYKPIEEKQNEIKDRDQELAVASSIFNLSEKKITITFAKLPLAIEWKNEDKSIQKIEAIQVKEIVADQQKPKLKIASRSRYDSQTISSALKIRKSKNNL